MCTLTCNALNAGEDWQFPRRGENHISKPPVRSVVSEGGMRYEHTVRAATVDEVNAPMMAKTR